jgi:hypothetical protein
VWDKATPGFGLRVSAGGALKYICSGRIKGGMKRQCLHTIGRPSTELTLKEAQKRAARFLLQMHDGVDPRAQVKVSEREREALSITLQQALDVLKKKNQKKNRGLRRDATIDSYQFNLDTYLEGVRDKPMASTLTPELCETIFEAISEGGLAGVRKLAGWHTPEKARKEPNEGGGITVANNVMRDLHALCEVVRKKFRDRKTGLPLVLVINPVAEMREWTPPNPTNPRSGRIDLSLIREVYAMWKQMGETGATPLARTGADSCRFRLLTGIRPFESFQLRFSYIQGNWIVLPGEITKNHEEQWFPMNRPLRELIAHRRAVQLARLGVAEKDAPDDWVFPSDRNPTGHITSAREPIRQARALNPEKGLIPYDLRRTFVDMANACNIDGDIRRHLLNHCKDVHDKCYNNKRELLIAPVERMGEWIEGTQDWDQAMRMPPLGEAQVKALAHALSAALAAALGETHAKGLDLRALAATHVHSLVDALANPPADLSPDACEHAPAETAEQAPAHDAANALHDAHVRLRAALALTGTSCHPRNWPSSSGTSPPPTWRSSSPSPTRPSRSAAWPGTSASPSAATGAGSRFTRSTSRRRRLGRRLAQRRDAVHDDAAPDRVHLRPRGPAGVATLPRVEGARAPGSGHVLPGAVSATGAPPPPLPFSHISRRTPCATSRPGSPSLMRGSPASNARRRGLPPCSGTATCPALACASRPTAQRVPMWSACGSEAAIGG